MRTHFGAKTKMNSCVENGDDVGKKNIYIFFKSLWQPQIQAHIPFP